MVFNSFGFLIFFPIFLILYRILPLKIRWIMMLTLSYFFYMAWQADLIYLILFTTATSFFAAKGIEKFKDRPTLRKVLMITAVSASLFVLFFFKYFNFISENVTGIMRLFGSDVKDFSLNLILPVGISFYTFQTLSYVIDVYRGTLPAERHFGYYALYVSFFPQLVAGPIERPENLLPQLKEKNAFNVDDTVYGLKMMLVGFFKKIAVADQISKYVDAVYNNASGESSTWLSILVATLLFAVQIYCDFSGYTDIAIGCSRILGIRLMQNFNDPYSATNIKDFWRRWHISLTSWFTDYVYIPLGGSRCKKARHLTNIMIVFLLSGIWHGAAWTYVLWGVLHGIYQIVGNLTAKPRSRLIARLGFEESSAPVRYVRTVITFLLVSFAWMLFRANSIADFGILTARLFSGYSGEGAILSLSSIGITPLSLITAIFSVLILKLLDTMIATRKDECRETVDFCPVRSSVYIYLTFTVCCAWLILLASNSESAFIYFQF